jgi:hypothetical protein
LINELKFPEEISSPNNFDDQMAEDQMGGTRSTHDKYIYTEFCSEETEEKRPLGK